LFLHCTQISVVLALRGGVMKIKDVPLAPAYLVFHDAYDNGAMDVWPAESLELAQKTAAFNQDRLESLGQDECGGWKAYEKLPRIRVWKFHPAKAIA
jgi:hypothetical protein